MHDLKSIREMPKEFDAGMARRGHPPQSAKLLELDTERRKLQTEHDKAAVDDALGRCLHNEDRGQVVKGRRKQEEGNRRREKKLTVYSRHLTVGSRQLTVGSQQSAVSSRQSTVSSQPSAIY